jgi:hypothetical protein
MQGLSFLCLVLYTLVSGVVGVRLLLRARKTRGVPELLIGLAYVTAPATGYPLVVISPLLPSRALALPLHLVGETLLVFGCCCALFFTVRVFRPGQAWALWCAALGSLVLAVAGIGVISAFATYSERADSAAHSRIATAAMVFVLGLSYGWTALEGLRYHRMMRKRMELGLADAVVTNRFLLWAVSGFVSLTWDSVSAGCLVAGVDLRNGLALFSTSAGGLVNTILLVLIFMPPAAYLRWVTRSARHGALAPV